MLPAPKMQMRSIGPCMMESLSDAERQKSCKTLFQKRHLAARVAIGANHGATSSRPRP